MFEIVKTEMTSIQDIDPVEFLEGYIGVELLPYQKEILKRMWNGNKIYIYPWQDYERTNSAILSKIGKILGLYVRGYDA